MTGFLPVRPISLEQQVPTEGAEGKRLSAQRWKSISTTEDTEDAEECQWMLSS